MQSHVEASKAPRTLFVLDHPSGPTMAQVSYMQGEKIVARVAGRVSTYHTGMVFLVPNGAEAHVVHYVGHA